MAIQRENIERLLAAYVSALNVGAKEDSEFQEHLSYARSLLFRWQGGESLDALRDALLAELRAYIAKPPPGKEAELAGRAYGDLCRGCGLVTHL